MIRRREQSAMAGGPNAFPDETWVKGLPLLCEYLSLGAFEDGTPRELSTVTIRYQDGLVLASLSDHEERAGLYRTGESVQLALKALEKALSGGTADWRPWGGSKKPKK